eukprot:evm.model.scf_343.3 EVM.evm.TU.scf_343.3   scf_343:7469-8556(+)
MDSERGGIEDFPGFGSGQRSAPGGGARERAGTHGAAEGPSSTSQMQLRSNSGSSHGVASGQCNGHHSSISAGGNCRFDSSLNTLTKKFIDLIARAKDGILDLNTAEQELKVLWRCQGHCIVMIPWVQLQSKSDKGARSNPWLWVPFSM